MSMLLNYRPVSLTSVICKLLETIIRDHMTEFFFKHKLINPSQDGFLKARSCLTNLLCFFEEITKCVDEGSPVDVIYLDFQKASTYKFKRTFFRHDRRTAPKFGTHVRIETRLALTQKKLTNPTPEGFRGLFVGCLLDVCGMFVGCLWDVCGMFVGCLWDVCGMFVGCLWDVCGMFVGCLWVVCGMIQAGSR